MLMQEDEMRLVAAARGWIGTPYRHQASCRGGGTDCLGLIRGLWRECYGAEPAAVPAYGADWGELGGEDAGGREPLWQAAAAHLRALAPEAGWRPGQVLLFRMRAGAVAKHLGLLAPGGAGGHAGSDEGHWHFIHAYCGKGVVESPLSRPWARRIVARFAFPAMRE